MTTETNETPIETAGPVVTTSEQAQPKAAPVATQADAEEADEQNDPEDSANSDGNDDPARPKNKGVGKRINELTKDKHDAIREREYWQQEAERLRAQIDPRPAPTQVAQSSGEKTLEDFDFDQVAYLDYMTDQKVSQKLQERDRQAEGFKRQQSFQEKVTAFAADHPDYDEVTSAPHVPLTEAVSQVLMQADNPPEIAYYLATHLDEATAIARMHPIDMARAIGRIEHALTAPTPNADPLSPPKTVTKAPAPVATLRPSAPIKKSLEELPMDEYAAERTRQRKALGLIP